jgi:predicted nucleic acid-binding protein
MAALADTSILIDHLRGRNEAQSLVERELLDEEPVFGSLLTKTEVLAGVRREEEDRTRQLLDLVVWIDVTDPIAEQAGRLANRYGRTHPGVDLVDYVIAATREALEVPLWTLNVRYFPMIRGLRPPY